MNGAAIIIGVLPLLVAGGGMLVTASEPLTTEMIEERIAAIGVRSIQSASGHLVVSGPEPLQNAALLSLAETTASAVEELTGVKLPFNRQSVRILVVPPTATPLTQIARLEHNLLSGGWIHRVVLANYASMETMEAAEVLSTAFLSVYQGALAWDIDELRLPDWLRFGALRGLTVAGRQETIDVALSLWREGRLPALSTILSGVAANMTPQAVQERDVACGAFLQWFAGYPERDVRFLNLFRRLSEGRPLDVDWVRTWLPEGGDPGEQWDRWLLTQRTVVRNVGTVSLLQLEALYAEWMIYPGRGGIPFSVRLPERADCTALVRYRDESWFNTVLRTKRHQIEILAPGRPLIFQTLTAAYLKVLTRLEDGASPAEIESLAAAARRQWVELHERVQQAGGVWSEPRNDLQNK